MVTGEKRNSEEERMMEKVTAILLDVEGTTTSISFVKDKLFPYVREQLQAYIDSHWDEDEFKQDLQALKDLAKKDAEEKVEGLIAIEDGDKEKESLIKNILWQMDSDRKTTALKQLQGHIWREGYKNGKLKGHLYDDVASCLKKWSEDGRRLFIYSSGSVEAQKLLFGNTEEGDLLGILAGHYDTTVGPKTESASYTNIAKSIGCDSEQILFLTDVVKEAQAAKTAGMQTLIVVREGNAELSEDEKKEFVTVTSFKDIIFESSAKKKKMSNGEESVEEPEKVEKVEKMEKEAEPVAEKKELNGDEVEKMDVDASVEETKEETTKPETSELKEDCKEKTVETAENKTEDKVINKETEESKTESDEVVVNVTSDDKKETKEEEKIEKPESDKTNEKIPEEKSNEDSKKTPEEPAKDEEVKKADTEPVKENNEAPATEEVKTKPVEEKEKGEVVADGEKKEVEAVDDKKETVTPVEDKKEAETPVEEKKEEKEKGEVVDDVKEIKEAETNDAKPEAKKDEPVENNKVTETKEEAKELNGKTNGKENGVAEKEEEEAITVKKVIPDEPEAAAVEVQA